ncbi:hypothetical protein CPT_Spernnie_027 [Streptomyces phage Spernnie]|uniref:Uncharacterized protein n=1 Tax=Streptomyces phage Spernnie TaxID=2767588 RepID=A0A873WPP4_9CAUD|nr:hypothetical protein KGG74_gp27 [Streptomyces phage Spernnie]QPB09631.1 hypothetical protein CPT_Spernnie_027 [Streptomyces phage Spernnie]
MSPWTKTSASPSCWKTAPFASTWHPSPCMPYSLSFRKGRPARSPSARLARLPWRPALQAP